MKKRIDSLPLHLFTTTVYYHTHTHCERRRLHRISPRRNRATCSRSRSRLRRRRLALAASSDSSAPDDVSDVRTARPRPSGGILLADSLTGGGRSSSASASAASSPRTNARANARLASLSRLLASLTGSPHPRPTRADRRTHSSPSNASSLVDAYDDDDDDDDPPSRDVSRLARVRVRVRVTSRVVVRRSALVILSPPAHRRHVDAEVHPLDASIAFVAPRLARSRARSSVDEFERTYISHARRPPRAPPRASRRSRSIRGRFLDPPSRV